MAVQVEEWAVVLMNNAFNVADPYRQLVPTNRGESLQDQIYPWDVDGLKKKMQQPFQPHEAAPETLSNIINMMAVEAQHWHAYSSMTKSTNDPKFKSLLNDLARAEQVHHLKLMSLIPKPHAPVEFALEGEVALMTAYGLLMSRESNDSIHDALMQSFLDHQTHAEFAAQNVQKAGCDPTIFTGGADLSGGRPLNEQFVRPADTMWNASFNGSYDRNTVDPLTLINVDMALAGELAAWDLYHCAMVNEGDSDIRTNFAAFQAVESEHVSILGSIKSPMETPLERAIVHEAVEISSYAMMRDMEEDKRVAQVFDDLYREDLEQGYILGQFMK